MITIADNAGLKGSELLENAKDNQWSDMYASTTKNALESGVVGSPTYEVGDELFWGQDRLDFLEHVLD